MRVVAFFSPLKGVGKTTLMMALADFLSSTYQRSLLMIDLDPTGDLTVRLIGDQRWWALERDRRTVIDGLMVSPSRPEDPLHVEAIHRIEGAKSVGILAGTARLAELERMPAGGDPQEHRLKTPLRELISNHLSSNSYIFINMPPQLGELAMWALAACDGYLLVLNPTRASSSATSSADQRLQGLAAQRGVRVRRYGSVLNRSAPGSSAQELVQPEIEQNQALSPLWTSRIPSSESPLDAKIGPQPLRARWRSLYGPLDALALEFVRRIP